MQLVNHAILITRQERDQIEEYAREIARRRTAEYTRRLADTVAKQQLEQVRGKIAEVAAFHMLKAAGLTPEYPDFEIWTDKVRRQKGHCSDIVTSGGGFGVKSVKANHKDPSWVFQKSDPLRDDKYLLFLVNEDYKNGQATLRWSMTPSEIREFQAPLVMHAPSKFAVYDKHLLASMGDSE
jgi:hypothetical protein